MSKPIFTPRKPDFKDPSGIIAIWVQQDKETKEPYLAVKVFGSTIYCRKPKPKPEAINPIESLMEPSE